MNDSIFSMIPLRDLSVIKISGADAADFLHGQLTQDIVGLPAGQARLAAYCTPKGRLLATLVIWRDPAQPDELTALVKTDIAEALVKRLSMFVLRAKVKLAIEPNTVLGIGLPAGSANTAASADASTGAQKIPGERPAPPKDAPAWTVVQTNQGTWISAPHADADTQRWWLVAVPDSSLQAQPATGSQTAWQAADIAAGLPWIEAATQDVFIPQTLNLDLIEGVHFTKGCYPGQEVVARSHYRGTVKRRMAYGIADSAEASAPAPGADIFDTARPKSPSGRIINVAVHDGQAHMLLEIHLADLETAEYRLNSIEGAQIGMQPLPYRIDEAR